MEEIPDPSKKPHELREEFGRKISEITTNEINRTGRERIEAAINKLVDDYSLEVGLHIDIDIKMNIDPMSGKDFVWPEMPPPDISFDDSD